MNTRITRHQHGWWVVTKSGGASVGQIVTDLEMKLSNVKPLAEAQLSNERVLKDFNRRYRKSIWS